MTLAVVGPEGKVTSSKAYPFGRSQTPVYHTPSNSTVSLLGGISASYEDLYWHQPWVHTVINKLTRAIARLPLKTYSLNADGDRERERTVPLAKMIRNPYPRARARDMVEFIVGSVCVHGNAIAVKSRGAPGRTPIELWPSDWKRWQIITGLDRPIEAYVYTPNDPASRKVFLAEDVVHFHWYNPRAEPFGRSPLESLQTTLALEDASQRYAVSNFGNSARPASFITSERNMTKEQRTALREEINEAYGGPDNAFKVALLDNGLDWKPLAHSAQESEYVNNRKLTREEVCAVYDVPPPMVGILDNATYSNITQQHWMLYMDSLSPILSMIEDTLMAQLVDPEPAWDGLFVEFDMNEVLRGNIAERSQAYLRFLEAGVYTPNELREMENKKRVNDPRANAIYVPSTLVALSKQVDSLEQAKAEVAFDQQMQLAASRPGPGEKPADNGNKPPPVPAGGKN